MFIFLFFAAWPTTHHPPPATRHPLPVYPLPATRHPSPVTRGKVLPFMQISVDVYNEPFVIKCCSMLTTQTKALLYIYWLLMINKLFVEWISRQNQLLCRKYLVEPGNEKDQLSPICSYGTWRLETPQYDDTQSQSIYKRTWKWGKTPERNSTTCEWISPTCREKPERQCSKTIHCQRNLISHIRQKKIIVFIIWPAKKILGRSSWPATYCPLFWALTPAECPPHSWSASQRLCLPLLSAGWCILCLSGRITSRAH